MTSNRSSGRLRRPQCPSAARDDVRLRTAPTQQYRPRSNGRLPAGVLGQTLAIGVAGLLLWLGGSPISVGAPTPAPLFDHLGDHHHPISTSSPKAQRYFDQGMVLLYGFNHAEAIRSFEAAATVDPAAPMPHWGIAYALGPNINLPMADSAVPRAWEALRQAQARLTQASESERAYIQALATRYRPEPMADRSELDRAFCDAMREVRLRFPDDLDAATLFAEAAMDTMPWNYWELDRRPKPLTQEVFAALRSVLRRAPNHPGANHFFIHAVEAGPTPEDAMAAADRLRALELGTAHLVHMPSHIYLRTGRYGDAIDVNAVAERMDRRYIRACRAQGFYPAGYYPHNIHFLWYASVMAGRSQTALAAAQRIEELEQDVRCGPNTLAEAPRLRHLTLLTLARFGQWEALARQPEPEAAFPLDRALWHYSQGLGALAREDVAAAGRHLATVQQIQDLPEMKAMDNPFFPATMVLGVAEAALAGQVALTRGATEQGLDRLRQAVDREDAIPYMEPPYWHGTPTRQTLGAALIKAERAADAEQVFRADLDHHPRNGWALHGLRECLRQLGRPEAANAINRQFAVTWKGADVEPNLDWY